MKDSILSKKIQKGVAFTAMTTFLIMPVNMACANDITAGSSSIGAQTGIVNNGNITNITSGFIQGGTGINHFNNFTVSQDGVANLLGAQRYINLVNEKVGIYGTLNAYQGAAGNPLANVLFISPKGMAIGSSGVLNVAGLQAITPSAADYNSLIGKGTGITVSALEAAKAGGTAGIDFQGLIALPTDISQISNTGGMFSEGNVVMLTNGSLTVGENGLSANKSINLSGGTDVTVNGDLIAKDGYIAVTSADGAVSMKNATLNTGNIDIKGAGDVSHGVLTISNLAPEYKDTVRYDYKTGKEVNGIAADEATRDDGVRVTSTGGKITGTHISSANRVDLTAKGDISGAGDNPLVIDAALNTNNDALTLGLISANSENNVNLKTLGTARLGKIDAKNINIIGNDVSETVKGNIYIDDKITGGDKVNIAADGTVTIRPRVLIKDNGAYSTYTYGSITGTNDVNVTATNGNIYATDVPAGSNGNMITTTKGGVTLYAGNDINGSNSKIKVKAKNNVNATAGGNINLALNNTGLNNVGTIESTNNAGDINIDSAGNMKINNKISGKNVTVDANGSITSKSSISEIPNGNTEPKPSEDIISTGTMKLTSADGSVGSLGGILIVNAGGPLTAKAEKGSVYIGSANNLNVEKAAAKDAMVITTGGDKLTVADASVTAGNLSLGGYDIDITKAVASKNVDIYSTTDVLVRDKVEATKGILTIGAIGGTIEQNVEGKPEQVAFVSGTDMTLKAYNSIGNNGQKLYVKSPGTLDARSDHGGVYIHNPEAKDITIISHDSVNYDKVTAPNGVTIKSTDGSAIVGTLTSTQGGMSVSGKTGVDLVTANVKYTTTVASSNGDVTIGSLKSTDGNVSVTADIGNILVNDIIDAGADLDISAGRSINQKDIGHLSFKSGNNMSLRSEATNAESTDVLNVGDPDKYLQVQVGGNLTANAKQGGVYIGSPDKPLKIASISATGDIGLTANGDLTQVYPYDLETPYIISGGNMALSSINGDVGKPENYLSVKVGGNLDAGAPNGGVYIGSKENLNVNNVTAKTGAGLVSDGILSVINANVTGNGDLALNGTYGVAVTKAYAGHDVNVNSGSGVLVNNADGNFIEAGNNLNVSAGGAIAQGVAEQLAFKSGNDMTLISANSDVGASDKYLYVDAKGSLDAEAPNGGVYIYPPKAGKDLTIKAKYDVNLDNATAGGNATITSTGGEVNIGSISAGTGNLAVTGNDDVTIGTATAKGNATVKSTAGSVLVDNVIDAGNNLTISAKGAINQKTDKHLTFKSGKNMSLTSENSNVGDPDKYLQVQVGGDLTAMAQHGGVYIGSPENLRLAKVVGGNGGVTIAGEKGVYQSKSKGVIEPVIISGKNLNISSKTDDIGEKDNYLSVNVPGLLTATADNEYNIPEKGNIYIKGYPESGANLNIDKVSAAGDVVLAAKNITQNSNPATPYSLENPSIKAGRDLTLTAGKNGGDVGKSNNPLMVSVGRDLDATAPNGGVYIYNPTTGRDLNITARDTVTIGTATAGGNAKITSTGGGVLVNDKITAGNDLTIAAKDAIEQAVDGQVSFISGNNMKFTSSASDVGNPGRYLQVDVGGALSADAPNGGVYIGTPGNLVVDKIAAGKDVEIEADGFIHQKTPGGARPAITSGGDMTLISNHDNVGDPNDYLTVRVGGGLDAAAPEGGVYIYGYGNLKTDSVVAGDDVGIKGTNNIIIPHDTDDGNIIAGGNVKIEAGGSVLNEGGSGKGIDAGGDITILANLNNQLPPGSIGQLPYNDLTKSINVTLGGDATVDEIGVAPGSKILNINIMNPKNNGGGDEFSVDDRDLKMMNVLSDGEADNGSVNGRHARQDLRYNVATSEYILMNSNTDSGAKVQDVLNISKRGMLVQTDSLPNVGENISITMDYKGLPFTVDGTVVRTDKAHNTAGIQFNNIDQFTSSMILYLGMMNGKQ